MKNKPIKFRTFAVTVVGIAVVFIATGLIYGERRFKKGGSEVYEEAFRAGAFAGFEMGLETGRKCGKECEGFASVPFIIPE